MKLKNYSLLVLGFLGFSAVAQEELLPLDRALALALEYNHDLVIAETRLEIARNNASPGQANLLPTIAINAAANHIEQDFITSTFADGRSIGGQGAVSENINGSIVLNYNLFNGMTRYYTFKRLKRQEELSEAEFRFTMEATMLAVMGTYYEVARLFQNLQVQEQSLAISLDRYTRVSERAKLGAGNTLDVLNARVDLSSDSVAFITQLNQLETTKRNLQILMGQEPTTAFQVDTNLALLEAIDYPRLRQEALEGNSSLEQALLRQESARLEAEAQRGGYMPSLDFQAGYQGSAAENQQQFVVSSANNGWNAGLVFRWTLFNGTRTRTAVQNARLNLAVAMQQSDLTRKSLLRDLDNAYATYTNAAYVQGVEARNLEAASLNFGRTRDLFSLGQVTTTQFREAQLNLVRTRANYNNARFAARLAEVQLLRLAGKLTQSP